jgi:type III pantothenate kinase
VDIGNSNIVVGRFAGRKLAAFWRLITAPDTEDEALLRLVQLTGRPNGEGIAAVLCSVVPMLTIPWADALQRWSGAPPLEVNATSATSMPIRYHDPSAVGADRIANAIAARDTYGTPAIVVDLGTATTFDCVSEQGEYLGGAIAPGVGIAAEELFRRAARIPRVELRKPTRAVGRTTEETMRAGIVWGAAGAVDALVRRITREMKGTPQVIATGGWAKVVAPECETVQVVDEGLTLEGMRLLWEEQP